MPSHQKTVSWHCNANWLQSHHIPPTKAVLLDLASKKTVTDRRENRCNGFAARNQRQNNSPSMTSISRHKHISSLKEKQIATDNVPRCLAAFSQKRCWTTSCASCCDQGGHEDWKMSVLCFDLFVLWWPSAYERSSSIRRTGKTIGGIIIENMRNGECSNAARFTVNLTS